MLTLKRKAEVIDTPSETNGWRYVVRDETGEEHYLRGIAKSPEVGTKGTISYRQGPSYALWFFDPSP